LKVQSIFRWHFKDFQLDSFELKLEKSYRRTNILLFNISVYFCYWIGYGCKWTWKTIQYYTWIQTCNSSL